MLNLNNTISVQRELLNTFNERSFNLEVIAKSLNRKHISTPELRAIREENISVENELLKHFQ
jgi:hypothetical protein